MGSNVRSSPVRERVTVVIHGEQRAADALAVIAGAGGLNEGATDVERLRQVVH